MRKFLFGVVLLLVVYFVISRFAEARQLFEILHRGDWRWLAGAVAIQCVWAVNLGASVRAIYRALGVEEKIERLIPLSAAANFINVIAPSAGLAGAALYIADARRRNLPASRVSTATALLLLFDYLAFLILLALGLIVLFRRNQLSMAEIVASLILAAMAFGLGTLVYIGMRSPERLGQALGTLSRLVNRVLRPFIHRDYLSEDRAHEFAHDAAEGLQRIRTKRSSLLLPLGLALSGKAFQVSILFLVFMAFQQPFSVGTLIAGFSIGYLFVIVSPTPAGIGFVEGILTLTLTSLGVPLAAAAVISLAYHGMVLWLPLSYGALAFRWISREKV
jgi:uncharacterized protein (TIRG00374 family)